MLGLTDETAGMEGDVAIPDQGNSNSVSNQDTRVHAVFNKSGPTDLISCYSAPIVKPFLRDLLGPLDEGIERYREASPISYLSNGDPPVMTIHGELDPVVPVEQGRKLDERMKALGLSHQYLELKGEKHIFSHDGGAKYWEACFTFFDEQLKNRQESVNTNTP